VDPQGSGSSGLGVNGNDIAAGTYELLLGEIEIQQAIRPTSLANLDLIAAGQRLSGAEIELVSMLSRESRLKAAIASIRDTYDYIYFDTPPSLGLLTLNALTA